MKLFFLSCIFPCLLSAQTTSLTYFLPEETYDPSITTPEAFLGFQPGTQHVTHDQLLYYMYRLDEESPRISIEAYAKSHENRPLIALRITSPKNQPKLNQIRLRHLASIDPEKPRANQASDDPLIVYLGYSVHGNEASGGNAALLVAYYLAASQQQETLEWLENSVILLDPCFNPDGFQRFSTWVNMHKGQRPATFSGAREFNEAWPGGRTNHYWFDLNRDWLFLQHPESKGRVGLFQQWKPHVLTDHHEMGSNNTFFFQPGIPSAVNPLIPVKNQELTAGIAKFHSRILDEKGIPYYSGESFDDYYAGKGSTYTDLNGCIGILFEQASSRGHLQQTENGLLSFAYTIRNHVLTSFSTLRAAHAMQNDLKTYQRGFFEQNWSDGKASPVKAIALTCRSDGERMRQFTEMAAVHGIEMYRPLNDLNTSFTKEQTLIIPFRQLQYKLIRAMFDRPTTFTDSTFYDISTWTLSYALDLDVLEITDKMPAIGEKISTWPVPAGSIRGGVSRMGYLLQWTGMQAPKALNQILEKGLLAKLLQQPCTFQDLEQDFDRGSIFIPVNGQTLTAEEIYTFLKQVAEPCGLTIYSVGSGQKIAGLDLGSPSHAPLSHRKVLIAVGDGISAYDAGELWHLLDVRYGMEVNLMDIRQMTAAQLRPFNTILLPDGQYSAFADTTALIEWVERGNTLIAFQNSIQWLAQRKIVPVRFKKQNQSTDDSSSQTQPYADYASLNRADDIAGAILQYQLDLTHPLCFGMQDGELGLLHQGKSFMQLPDNQFAAPVVATASPLLSGFLPAAWRDEAAGCAGVIVARKGSGRVICIQPNPAFRAIWQGSFKLVANAIFFGSAIALSTAERE